MGRYPIVSTSRIINFGFISLSDCSAIRHKILNTSNDILHIKLTIESNASNQDFGPDDEGTFEVFMVKIYKH